MSDAAPIRTDVPRRVEVYRCEKCERRAEQPQGAAVPECGEYTPGSKQRFPDGSWIMLGESYAPHGPMLYVETIDNNPLAGYRDDARRATRLEATRAERDAEYERHVGTPVDVPASVTRTYPVLCKSCGHRFTVDASKLTKGSTIPCPLCASGAS